MDDASPLPSNGRNVVELAAEIVSAYVTKNSVPAADLPELIGSVHSALVQVGTEKQVAPVEPLVPPVPIKRSITPDYIISLEDGRHYKSMKRHLTGRGLTPDEYRRKWGLPHDYPMVAPNYAKARSELAKSMGLGRKPSARKQTGKRARKG